MAFWQHEHILYQTAALMDAQSLARVRAVCSLCKTLKDSETVRYVASMRSLRQDLSTLEQIALAESLAELATEIRFEYREVTLQESSYEPLERFAAVLHRHRDISVSIEGHCGLEAPRAMGFEFTRERANAVKVALVDFGIDEDRLRIVGYSNTRPLVWELGDGPGAPNRRVELYVQIHGIEVPQRLARFPAQVSRPENRAWDAVLGFVLNNNIQPQARAFMRFLVQHTHFDGVMDDDDYMHESDEEDWMHHDDFHDEPGTP